MYQHLIVRWLILSLAAGVAVTGALGQEKFRLRGTYSPGDTCKVDNSVDMSFMLTVNVPGSGQGDQQIPYSERQRESYEEKVLAVDRRGPSVVRRTYSIARTVTTDPQLHQTTEVSSLQGKTVTIRRTGEHVSVTSEPGKLSPQDEREMAGELSHTDEECFPDRDVAAGEEWPIDPHIMLALFPGMEKAEAQYHFQRVVPHAGHQCALIHVSAEVHGNAPGTPVPMTIKLDGELYHALDLKRTVSEDVMGPVTLEGRQQQGGVDLHVSGQGTVRIQETTRWLKVDGKLARANG